MGEQENRQLLQQVREAFESGQAGPLADLYHEDAIQEWPQSGERLRGKKNIMAVNDNYPGMPKGKVRDLAISGDLAVLEAVLDYGGGKPVYLNAIYRLKDGKVIKETDYFADPFEAPEWRQQWVEKMEPERVGAGA